MTAESHQKSALSPDDYAQQFSFDLYAHDLLSDRSRHADEGGIGASSFGCREEIRRTLLRVPASDSPDKMSAFIGSYIDAGIRQARAAANPQLVFGSRLVATLFPLNGPKDGYKLPVSPDEVDPDEPSCTDYKGLALDTPIPTPSGWTTMSELRVGDRVFGSDGKPCNVVARSAVKNIPTYIVKFGDGSQIVCDEEHYWWVLDGYPAVTGEPVVRQVQEIRKRLIQRPARNGGRPVTTFRVPNAEPLDLPEAELPIHPWALGAWLGDGNSYEASVTIGEDDYADMALLWKHSGHPLGRAYTSTTHGIGTSVLRRDAETGRIVPNDGFRSRLRALGVRANKHVPPIYLRASAAQRVALVQGLMDTDGSWNGRRRRAVFTTTSKQLAEDVYELLVSLGEKPIIDWRTVTGFGVEAERCCLEWTPRNFNPFRLPRKAERVEISEGQRTKASVRTIVAVEEGPDVPTACIAVDSPNRTYLCGRQMVPTHNTKDGLAAIRRGFVEDQARFQRHLQYLAAHQAGLVPPEGVVRNVFIDRSGKDQRVHVEQEAFSFAVIEQATEFLDDVLYAVKNKEEAMKDRPRVFCKNFCRWFTDCRGSEIEVEEITDPDLVARVDALGEAREKAKDETALAEALLDDGLRGLTGRTSRYQITSKWVNSTKQTPHWRVEVEALTETEAVSDSAA